MKTLLIVLGLFAAALRPAAADITGKWTGTFVVVEGPEQQGDHSAYLVLKQNGNELTGTAGPNEEEQFQIASGKVDGDKITFELQTNGPLMKFALVLADGHIKGDVTAEKDGETRKAKLDVTRKSD